MTRFQNELLNIADSLSELNIDLSFNEKGMFVFKNELDFNQGIDIIEEIVGPFGFIPYEDFLHDYERGHFYLTDSKEHNKIDDTVKFIVTKFSLLKRDCDLSNPFSCKNEWKEF